MPCYLWLHILEKQLRKFVISSLIVTALIAGVLAGGDPFAICDEPKNEGYVCPAGTGDSPQTLYYYDGITGFCEVLNYGGCGGNNNRFADMT
jgi:Kunitz/Bovine pancreatic trypsin inhibitor domain